MKTIIFCLVFAFSSILFAGDDDDNNFKPKVESGIFSLGVVKSGSKKGDKKLLGVKNRVKRKTLLGAKVGIPLGASASSSEISENHMLQILSGVEKLNNIQTNNGNNDSLNVTQVEPAEITDPEQQTNYLALILNGASKEEALEAIRAQAQTQ